jgi:S-adenosylmethionine:tRNA ribosyltransferase-isomerase
MRLSDYDYDLPESFIAQEAVHPKSDSKLLVMRGKELEIRRFYNIIDYLRPGDVLVLNRSKVAPCKLVGRKGTGARAEVILLDFNGRHCTARVFTRNPKPGTKLMFANGIEAEVIRIEGSTSTLRFNKDEAAVRGIARLPLPPYIKEELQDEDDYQTVYAQEVGSVAAPTAGLHFTRELLKDIIAKGVGIAEIVLHVGFGTFTPVRAEDPRDHKMESEWFTISEEAAKTINLRKGRLFVVGTTSLRSLESAAQDGRVRPVSMETGIYIYPGYEFKLRPDGFITNFHLPRSTLLLLVSALAGRENILRAYEFAKKNGFRFYSLGDSMLIL